MRKLILICICLLFVMVGAVSAQEQNSKRTPNEATIAMKNSDTKQEKNGTTAGASPSSAVVETSKSKDAWDLGRGSRGEQVVQLQKVLAQVGFYPAAVDGVFGGQTEVAVKKAQRSLGIEQTGRADRILVEGVRRMTEMSPSRSGAGFRSSRVLTMEATAYTPYDSGVVGITASGHPMRRGLVAVDPRVIPMGTRMYIEGYGYAIASDTGGAIRGHKIDLAVDTLAEAYQIGRRKVTVHILE